MSEETNRSGGDKPAVPSNTLLCCPSCMFDDAAYDAQAKRMGHRVGQKDGYMPKLYRDRFLGKWVVECQNCGMEVVFNSDSEADHAKLWNELPRKHNPTVQETVHKTTEE